MTIDKNRERTQMTRDLISSWLVVGVLFALLLAI